MEPERSDHQLVAAIAGGERLALEQLYQRHRHKLWAFIRRYVADEQRRIIIDHR